MVYYINVEASVRLSRLRSVAFKSNLSKHKSSTAASPFGGFRLGGDRKPPLFFTSGQ